MEQHEVWREQYRGHRYMEHLSDSELDQRAADVLVNFLTISGDGKLGALPREEVAPWLIRWTHVLEEMVLRQRSSLEGFVQRLKEVIPDPRRVLAGKAAHAVKNKENHLPAGRYLVKYGKAHHLQAAFERGEIRVWPASHYGDASLNPAMRDSEIELSIQPHPSELRLEVVDRRTGQPKGVIEPIRNIVTARLQTNYYMYCLSDILRPRLFLDFDADACLLVTKPDTFVERLIRGIEDRSAGWVGWAMRVTYIDPVLPEVTLGELNVYASKHFRYAYQREFRVLWLPPSPVDELGFIDLELGSLADCCELMCAWMFPKRRRSRG